MRHGQWLGLYPGVSNVGRTFRVGFRSERKALLQVLISLWKSHEKALGDQAAHTYVHDMQVTDYIELLVDEVDACVE